MKKQLRSLILAATASLVLFAPRANAPAAEFLLARGPFAIRIGAAPEPSEPAPVHVAPPKYYHPTAALFMEEPARVTYDVSSASPLAAGTAGVNADVALASGAGASNAASGIVVAPQAASTVYGPEHRTAPYLAAQQSPATIRRNPRHAPAAATSANALSASLDSNPNAAWQPGPYPTRYNPFQPTPYYGPGPHALTPNHFGGMTPLGPGPRPSFGPH